MAAHAEFSVEQAEVIETPEPETLQESLGRHVYVAQTELEPEQRITEQPESHEVEPVMYAAATQIEDRDPEPVTLHNHGEPLQPAPEIQDEAEYAAQPISVLRWKVLDR